MTPPSLPPPPPALRIFVSTLQFLTHGRIKRRAFNETFFSPPSCFCKGQNVCKESFVINIHFRSLIIVRNDISEAALRFVRSFLSCARGMNMEEWYYSTVIIIVFKAILCLHRSSPTPPHPAAFFFFFFFSLAVCFRVMLRDST